MTPTHPVMVCRLKAESCQVRNYPVQQVLLSNLTFGHQVYTVIVGSPACADHCDSTVRSTKGIRTPTCTGNVCGSIPPLPHQHPLTHLCGDPCPTITHSSFTWFLFTSTSLQLYFLKPSLLSTKERREKRKGGRKRERKEGRKTPQTHSH
ncbi:hypothetical protein HJG60_009774 [Phyllostomus discolor]|uniref:Uncharacterized protein n=1 Tax=Phyllostomus discolor TaxID=89673 RepID=A0A834BCI9_9CHIR|nr:hypothetical protein HJG60_009774 [Phyllostomus discolor]